MKRMKLILLITFITTILFGQNLLNQPESVVYDALNSRYLVSNFGNGNIIQIDSTGTQSIYQMNVFAQGGLHIVDSILYVVCGPYGVKGYDLASNENVFNATITGSPNLNDITSDNNGNLYVSCPSENTIYKINIPSAQAWVFANQNMLYPNGIFFDEDNNRLLLVSYRNNSPIQAISLMDSIVTTAMSTNKDGLDGLTRDTENNYYFSSWQTNRVYKVNGEFNDPPEIFSTHGDDPADIFFDRINNVLAVPLFFTHQIEFVEAGTGIDQSLIIEKPVKSSLQNYPNPFNPTTEIRFEIKGFNKLGSAGIQIYNMKGQKIRQYSIFDNQSSIVWNGTDQTGKPVSSGIYLYKLIVNDKIEAQNKMTLIK